MLPTAHRQMDLAQHSRIGVVKYMPAAMEGLGYNPSAMLDSSHESASGCICWVKRVS